MTKFLLQLEDNGHYSEDVAVIERLIRERNWLHPNETSIEIQSCYFTDLTDKNTKGTIAVGSIEFINKALALGYGAGPMTPINIPSELFKDDYTGRRCAVVQDKEDIPKLFKEWGTPRLFIKSNSRLKTGYTDIYSFRDNIPDDEEYFVSEPIDVISEWRCFVYRDVLKDIKNYSGDPWTLPKQSFVENCIKRIGDNLTAYTLDVAVTSDGKSVVIEVHNFVSCGLYGFDNPSLIPMLVNGFKRETVKKECSNERNCQIRP